MLITPVVFDQPINEVSLKMKIGQNVYSLGDIIQNDVVSIVTRFKIANEMLTDANETTLFIQYNSTDTVRMGFQGLGSCEGQGKRDFHTNGYKTYHDVKKGPQFEYEVSVFSIEE